VSRDGRAAYRRLVEWFEVHDLAMVASAFGFLYAFFAAVVLFDPGAVPPFVFESNVLAGAIRTITFLGAAYALLALALNLQWGYAGLFNIGIAGFMAVGVYVMGVLVRSPDPSTGPPGLGLPLPVGILIGVLAAALVGLIAALPALRLRADYLAIVTLGFAEIIRLTIQSREFNEWLVDTIGVGTPGGSAMQIPRDPQDPIQELFFVDGRAGRGTTAFGDAVFALTDTLGVEPTVIVDFVYALCLLAVVAAVYVFLDRLGRSPFGRVLKAIREDELVADSLGKDVDVFKIKAFMIGCGLMGLGGILWQGSRGVVSPNAFRPILTFYIFVALMVGGSGSNTGSVLGGIIFAGLLFEAPRAIGTQAKRLLPEDVASPSTFVDAVAPLASADVLPTLAYAADNVASLQFALLGVILVLLMQRRPEGVLGHRVETAAAVDISERSRGSSADTEGGDE